MIGAKVNVVGGWGDEFAKRVNRATRDAVQDAVEVGAREASAASLPRRRSGDMSKMDVIPVRATPTGWEAGFRSKGWYAGFQSRGTLGARKGKVKAATLARRASPSGQARFAKVAGSKGITPLGFLEKGRSAARKHLVARLNRL